MERNLRLDTTEPLFHRYRDCSVRNIGSESGGGIKRTEVTNLLYRGWCNVRKRLDTIGHSNAIYIYSDTNAPSDSQHLRTKPLNHFVRVPHLECRNLSSGYYIPLFSETRAGSTSRSSACCERRNDEQCYAEINLRTLLPQCLVQQRTLVLMGDHIRAAAHGRFDLSAIVGAPANLHCTSVLFFKSIMDKCFTTVRACQPFDTIAAIVAFILCHLKSP